MLLRPYQGHCIQAVRQAYVDGARAPLLVSPTGSGKTIMFGYITQIMQERGRQVGILAHRSELLDQIQGALEAWGVKVGDTVQVWSVAKLARRLDKLKFNPALWILDEAHHCAVGNTWGKIRAHYSQARWLGVTATPCRLDGKSLGESFDRLVMGPTVGELINDGYLSRFKIYAPPTVHTEGLHRRMGEFTASEVNDRVSKPHIVGDIIAHYQRLAAGKQFIAFCPSIEFAERLAGRFAEAGISCAAIHGHLSDADRSARVREFREASLCGITNCGIVEEGFDVPAVECGIFVTPTASLRRWLQSVGRCLRPKLGGGEATLLDHVGNTERHGFPDEPREWSLDGTTAIKRSGVQNVGVRVCPTCFAATLSPGTTCSACGGAFPVKPRAVAQTQGELTEADREAIRLARDIQQRQDRFDRSHATTLADLHEYARRKGYKPGWAEHIWRARQRRRA